MLKLDRNHYLKNGWLNKAGNTRGWHMKIKGISKMVAKTASDNKKLIIKKSTENKIVKNRKQ